MNLTTTALWTELTDDQAESVNGGGGRKYKEDDCYDYKEYCYDYKKDWCYDYKEEEDYCYDYKEEWC